MSCKHPPSRLYSWTAFDGVLCVACCECGAVLRGACESFEQWDAEQVSIKIRKRSKA